MSAHLSAHPAIAQGNETDDPRNRLLDAFEAQVEAMLANGLEAPLRARLARLLPMPLPSHPEVIGPDADLHLRAVTGARVLHDLAKARRSPAGAGQLNAIAATLAEIAQRTKGGA